jgi:serine/threonine protein kinase
VSGARSGKIEMAGGEGSAFGKYYLLKKIASGGMGEIFLAKLKGPVGFEKLLVIKRILAQHVENQEFLDMFFAEARIAAQLNHSNIVQIYEMGEIEDAYFIGMEYVYGKSLRDVIERVRSRSVHVHPAHAIEMVSELCTGMAYAHSALDLAGQPLGIIHRDINPQNVLVSYAGEVKLIDFGIAKSEMTTHKTETGTIKGKFVYMSPEQSAAEKLDKRSDIFSIGICLYETLTFVNPFARANIVLSLDAIQRQEPPPVGETDAALTVFEPILRKALAKQRDERYADCSDLRADLQALLRSGAVASAPQSLADWMHELFEDTIEAERRMIIDTDQANTLEIRAMRDYQSKENRAGSNKWKVPVDDGSSTMETPARGGDLAPGPAAVASLVEPHSRVPFYLLLAAIIAATAAGVLAMNRLARLRWPGRPTLTEITPLSVTTVPSGPPASEVATSVGTTAGSASPQTSPPTSGASPASSPLATGQAIVASSAVAAASLTRPTSPSGPSTSASGSINDRGDDNARPGREHPRRPRPEREERRPEPRSSPAAQGSFGGLRVSSVPPVSITLGGASVGQTLKLKAQQGVLVLGSGTNPQSDPFKITIRYGVSTGGISYAVDAEPWAIVHGRGGIGLGKTPLPPALGDPSTVFEFVNPRDRRQLRLTLHYTGP